MWASVGLTDWLMRAAGREAVLKAEWKWNRREGSGKQSEGRREVGDLRRASVSARDELRNRFSSASASLCQRQCRLPPPYAAGAASQPGAEGGSRHLLLTSPRFSRRSPPTRRIRAAAFPARLAAVR
jgi:hypothetical protein